jgi:hypothetical protein
MEDPRYRFTANERDEPRFKSMLDAEVIGNEDPRCNGLRMRLAFVSEAFESKTTTIKLEDPRCQNLHINW